MRKIAFLLLATALFSACNASPAPVPTGENDIIGGQVTVDFLAKAEQWPTSRIVESHRDYYIQHMPDYVKSDGTTTDEDYLGRLTVDDTLLFWKVGTINNGDYAGQSLVLAREACEGPCPASFFRYAVSESEDEENSVWTTLLPYSDEVTPDLPGGPAPDQEASISIPALDAPDLLELYSDDGVYLMDARAELDPNFYEDTQVAWDKQDFNRAFQAVTVADDSFAEYRLNNCLYGISPDGILVRYLVTPSIFGVDSAKGATETQPVTTSNYDLELVNGNTEKHEYMLFAGGCGFATSCIATLNAADGEEESLEKVGNLDGRDVFMFTGVTESDQPDYESLTGQVQSAYISYKMSLQYKDPAEEPLSISDYLAAHDIVFIKLENGDYILVYDTRYAPTVECGKPVIYLYPTTTQEVSVQVGGIEFSKTVPDYGENGWTVWASPKGLLKSVADGKTYPYLFWEGQSSEQISMEPGWTLAKADVSTQLPVALKSMGLTTRETADFMAFWLPRLQTVPAPYIQFNFEGTDDMNAVAPLTITPAPDSLLRVFMFYQGVSRASLGMPTYTAPARTGFSVVEWGGSLF